MKKPPTKVAHNRSRPFFSSTGLAAQTAQKQKSRTTKSPLMQDWVFRLGCYAVSELYSKQSKSEIQQKNAHVWAP